MHPIRWLYPFTVIRRSPPVRSAAQVVPGDEPLWYGRVGLVVLFAIRHEVVRYLERHAFYLRI
jgi:hypothetical protein